MSGSSVPAVTAALVDLWTGVAPTGLSVSDGPIIDPPGNFLAVGWDMTDSADGVAGQSSPADVGLAQNNEIYDVHCVLSFHEGSSDAATARTELFAAFQLLDQALSGDPKLGGACMFAQIGTYRLEQGVAETGATAFLRFTVHVRAWK